MPAQTKRVLRPDEIRCPAGVLMNDVDCFCRVEGGLIEGRANPESIERFCAGVYQECPTWKADREADWERRNLLRDGVPE